MNEIRPAMVKYWAALSKANQFKWPSPNAISDANFRSQLRSMANNLSISASNASTAYRMYVQNVCNDIEQTSMSQPVKTNFQKLIRERRYDLTPLLDVNIETAKNILDLCVLFDSPTLKCEFTNNKYSFANQSDTDQYASIYKKMGDLINTEISVMKNLNQNMGNYNRVTGVNLIYKIESQNR